MQSVTVGKLLMTIPVANQLGEGVQWDGARESIWWTDILSAVIYQFHLPSKTLTSFPMPHRVGSFGLTIDPNELIVAFDIGIARYHLKHKSIKWLAKPEAHLAGNRFNDGRTDRQGRFWAGTMVEVRQSSSQSAALYSIDIEGHCQQHISQLQISNGLCWSPDGKTMYHADSPSHTLFQYDFNTLTGKVSNKRVFATTPESFFPDGAEVDAHGCVWNAHWGGGQVVRYRADGSVDLTLRLPVTNPTSVAFGGRDLDLLIITSAKHALTVEQLADEPEAGNVFIFQLEHIHGLGSLYCQINANLYANADILS
ncbi:SMP-30/gluconolactonase/LRE family protein [Shewanella acanthi]|uniref:SMP-30/gluconolactonase/LRE family protein n=1 Tax=Shewanella acanthi TaxID=2864212 RepID=UPI001C65FFC3|nr:SMP-30/gluconolactonase/LRE family protein [Shewanella acanthi]QYJ77376.1 SMP-30/gluconolactonase/LRE family protein [Shewanella acanthi]